MISAIARVLKRMVDWHSSMTAPMRKWKYGADGKYVHIVLGIEAMVLFMMLALILDQRDLNLVGLSLYAVFAAGFVEFVQRAFLGGRNTKKQAFLDAFWMWLGGTTAAYLLHIVGFVEKLHAYS